MLCPPYHVHFHQHADSERLTAFGAPVPCAPHLDVKLPQIQHVFGVYWDEDHDERVLNLADTLHHHNVLVDFLAFHEHEGHLWAVLKDGLASRHVQALTVLDGASADVLGDSWSWEASSVRGLRTLPMVRFANGDITNKGLPVRGVTSNEFVKHRLGQLVRTDEWGNPE